MQDNISNYFTNFEKKKRMKIHSLMKEWQMEKTINSKLFCADGFFPGYFKQKQKLKLLFIAREPRWFKNGDIIEGYIDFYESRNDHNNKSFTRHIFNIVQGVKANGKIRFNELKEANEYAHIMSDANDYGFALINISKYVNGRRDSGRKANVKLMNKFLIDTYIGKNYFVEEMRILDPDIIITGNLINWKIESEYINYCFDKLKKIKRIGKTCLYEIVINRKKVKLIDTFHFSACKSDKYIFFDPIMKLIFK